MDEAQLLICAINYPHTHTLTQSINEFNQKNQTCAYCGIRLLFNEGQKSFLVSSG